VDKERTWKMMEENRVQQTRITRWKKLNCKKKLSSVLWKNIKCLGVDTVKSTRKRVVKRTERLRKDEEKQEKTLANLLRSYS